MAAETSFKVLLAFSPRQNIQRKWGNGKEAQIKLQTLIITQANDTDLNIFRIKKFNWNKSTFTPGKTPIWCRNFCKWIPLSMNWLCCAATMWLYYTCLLKSHRKGFWRVPTVTGIVMKNIGALWQKALHFHMFNGYFIKMKFFQGTTTASVPVWEPRPNCNAAVPHNKTTIKQLLINTKNFLP